MVANAGSRDRRRQWTFRYIIAKGRRLRRRENAGEEASLSALVENLVGSDGCPVRNWS
jgi:hypothetical protein